MNGPELKPCGFCYYCQGVVRSGVVFCPGGCAGDFEEQEQKIKQISGK
jgi:hypothetical protein